MTTKKKSEQRDQVDLDSLKTATQDGLINAKTGVGTSRDKGQAASYVGDRLDLNSARQIYGGSDFAQRIVDLPAREMTRRGWTVQVKGDPVAAKKANTILSDLKSKSKLNECMRKKRAFGGALVLVNVTDGVTDPSQPINMEKLVSVDSITVFEPGEASATEYEGNPTLGNTFSQPTKWQISPRVATTNAKVTDLFTKGVHPSRCFKISDEMLSRLDIMANFGFGDSVLSRVWRTMIRTDQNYASSGTLVDDFAQAVFKIKGLYKSLLHDKGAGARARLKLIDEYRSSLRGIVLDGDGEDFVRQPTPLTGLPDLIDRHDARLASAADMPLSVLFGKSPSGLAATGDMDVRMWYDSIAGAQELDIEPCLSWLLGLIFKSKKGPTRGKIPDDWEICFRPLWEPTEKEEAETGLAKAQTRQIYNQAGALDSEKLTKLVNEDYGLEDEDEEGADDLAETEGTISGVDPETGKPIMKPNGAAPVPASGGPQGQNVQTQALNGAQITSMLEVVSNVNQGKTSRESGQAILQLAFQLSPEQANSILGPEGFKPKEDPAPAPPVGGGFRPPAGG